jgi:hypothetical protein
MSKACILCNCNPNKYWNLFYAKIDYKLIDLCQHNNISLYDKDLCIKCSINSIRHTNKLENINNQDLSSIKCFKWKTGENAEMYCWKNNVLMCDVLNCNYPAIRGYTRLKNFMKNAQNNLCLTISLPTDICNIIILYAYKIHPTKNGLCINHDRLYNISIERIFNCEPMCNICLPNIFAITRNNDIINKLQKDDNYFYGNITLYHKPSTLCNVNINIVIDNKYYLIGGCLELCKQLGTWCEICKKCIGHNFTENNIYTHNIIKYKHCDICGIHSEYKHCEICNKHYIYSHCNICNIHSKYTHCEICNIHSEHLHCNICNKHFKDPHCDICGMHYKYPHCEICNKHYEYQHCETCWNLGHELLVHHSANKMCEKNYNYEYF